MGRLLLYIWSAASGLAFHSYYDLCTHDWAIPLLLVSSVVAVVVFQVITTREKTEQLVLTGRVAGKYAFNAIVIIAATYFCVSMVNPCTAMGAVILSCLIMLAIASLAEISLPHIRAVR